MTLEAIAAPDIIVDLRDLFPGGTVETMTAKALAKRTFATYHLGDPQCTPPSRNPNSLFLVFG